MMNSGIWERNAMIETLPNDGSTLMANSSRYPRGQRPFSTMRVTKPNSASNSPRGSTSRRRTMVADGPYRRRVAVIDQKLSSASPGLFSGDGLQVSTRSTRPASWHPSSQQAPQPYYQPPYSTQMFDFNNQFQFMDMPPTPMVYSGYASPASTFSPLSIPYNGYDQQQLSLQDVPNPYDLNSGYAIDPMPPMEEQSESYPPPPHTNIEPSMSSSMEWGNFNTSGLETSTAPPTPENFLPIQHPEPLFPSEDSIPYQPLSDTESVGEDLIGVGLYDTLDITKSYNLDPQLDNYRSLVMPQFLGSACRRTEATGKGLKLEETWNPPSNDGEEDDDDDERDGEAEDEDEPSNLLEGGNVQDTDNLKSQNEGYQAEVSEGSRYGGDGWL